MKTTAKAATRAATTCTTAGWMPLAATPVRCSARARPKPTYEEDPALHDLAFYGVRIKYTITGP